MPHFLHFNMDKMAIVVLVLNFSDFLLHACTESDKSSEKFILWKTLNASANALLMPPILIARVGFKWNERLVTAEKLNMKKLSEISSSCTLFLWRMVFSTILERGGYLIFETKVK